MKNGCITDDWGHRWYLNGKLHREDGPAVELDNGSREWWVNGQRHRVDGPAVEKCYTDSSEMEFRLLSDTRHEWWLNGKKVEDHPYSSGKFVDVHGNNNWYLNGQLHREDGPAVEWNDGDRTWWVNGKLHREDGPAIERADGDRTWYLNGELHRVDGPAVECADGSREWWVQGVQVRNVKSLKNFRERLKEAEKCISLKAFFEKENAERYEKQYQSIRMRSKKIKLENMKKKFVGFMKNLVKEGEFTEEELLEIYRLAMMESIMTT